MITHHEHYIEQDGNIEPAYVGENAPHFEHLEEVGHVATIDIMIDTANRQDAAEEAERAEQEAREAAERAELERLGLTDEALYEEWKRHNAEKAAEVQAEEARRKELAAAAPSRTEQLRNAHKVVREHNARVPKQVLHGRRGSRGTLTRRAKPRASDNKQLTLIG